ncbi:MULTISPECIES: hypothetical protein [Deinococcus]|uniref:TMhelix containing protein n=1 Tax=Deinococcus rufus TaxID=2136097 RepID=A0ABV7ZAG0_9DEIO|nr:hypothetical protein [Deinococcus sp. AB2017081]WQE94436.1 hypothetical protein U2P90_13605 [Deinococcus sp. AB2017081]
MDNINVLAKIAGMEKDIEYLKSGHAEFKEFMKRFEAVPYQINSINDKMDTLLDRVKAVEEEEDDGDTRTKKAFDWGADWIKYVALFLLGLVVIIGGLLGIPIPFIGGS